MKSKYVCLLLAFLSISFLAHTSSQQINRPNIVIFDLDGTERTVFYELLRSGQLPNIARLHVYNMTDNTEYNAKTNTRAQHAAMLSGYLANVTLVYDNTPDEWQAPLGEKSLFYRVHQALPNYYIVGFTAKVQYCAPLIIGDEKWERYEGMFINRLGFNSFVSAHSFIDPPNSTMPKGAKETILGLTEAKPSFLYYFHVCDPDEYGHQYGVDSQEYRKGIIDGDTLLGLLMNKLPNDVVYIVTSDHGFGEVNKFAHSNDPNTFVASNIPLRNGYEIDVSPTIYALLGIDYTQFSPQIDGTPLSTIDNTPPNIKNVTQIPPKDNVLPEDKVKMNATVTDALGELKKVTLVYAYANSSGAWIKIVDMTNLEGDIWNATIPAFPYGTNVTYTIIAEDSAGNTITTQEMGYEYQYYVIPEFPRSIILFLFMITTVLAIITYKRKRLCQANSMQWKIAPST